MLTGDGDIPEIDLGARIRTLRKARRLSIRTIAARCGLSPSFLSQFERGLSDVSIGSLRKICGAIGVTPAEVMAKGSPAVQNVIHVHERATLSISPGVRKYPVSSAPAESVEAYIGEVEPGYGTAEAAYSHGDSVEILFVLKGVANYEVDGIITELREGDSIEHRTALPHLLKNNSNQMVRVMWIIAPPSS